jgi:hypothetical protein
VKMCYINKLFARPMWKLNHNVFGVKHGKSILEHFAHQAMEVWCTLYPTKPFGVQNKDIISYSMAVCRVIGESKCGLENFVSEEEE